MLFLTIAHDEVIYRGRQLIIDTCQLPFTGMYETMAMYPNSHDLDTLTTNDPEAARANHKALLRKYTKKAASPLKPLAGRYLKLSQDLRTAAAAARQAAALSDDEGTCNCDTAMLTLPKWHGAKVKQAADAAGVNCSAFEWFGQRRYFVSCGATGQGNSRTAAAEAMAKALSDLGYAASVYYQMD